MPATMLKTVEPGLAAAADLEAVQQASRALARLSGSGSVHVEAEAEDHARQSFVLPAQAVRLLTDVLAILSQGRSVAVMPEEALLTTQQAADMLSVSRPYLIRLLEEGHLPFQKVGTHRRVRLHELLAYSRHQAEVAEVAMDELAAQTQELGME